MGICRTAKNNEKSLSRTLSEVFTFGNHEFLITKKSSVSLEEFRFDVWVSRDRAVHLKYINIYVGTWCRDGRQRGTMRVSQTDTCYHDKRIDKKLVKQHEIFWYYDAADKLTNLGIFFVGTVPVYDKSWRIFFAESDLKNQVFFFCILVFIVVCSNKWIPVQSWFHSLNNIFLQFSKDVESVRWFKGKKIQKRPDGSDFLTMLRLAESRVEIVSYLYWT